MQLPVDMPVASSVAASVASVPHSSLGNSYAEKPDMAGVVALLGQKMCQGVLERLVDQESHAV